MKWITGKNQPLTKTMQFGYHSSFPEQYIDLITGREIRERIRHCH